MSSSPQILPPGSPLQRSRPNNSKLLVTVSVILGVHVFLLAGLLIQGCKRQDNVTPSHSELTNGLPPLPSSSTVADVSAPEDSRVSQAPPTAALPATNAPTLTPAPQTPARTVPTPTPYPSTSTEGISSAPAATPGSTTVTEPASQMTSTDSSTQATTAYVVKAGDTLMKIARNHHTTAKAIRAANNLKTDRILVGQKLKVPQGKPGAHSASVSPRRETGTSATPSTATTAAPR